MFEVGATLALLALCIYMATLFSSVLNLHPGRLVIDNPRRESVLALFLIAALFVVTSLLEAIRFIVYRPMLQLDTRPASIIDQFNVMYTLVFYAPWFVLLFLVTRRTGQKAGSLGIEGGNKGRVLTFGLSLGVVYFVVVGLFSSAFGSGFPGFSTSHVWGFLDNIVISLSEETAWRGYIQTRLVAFGGVTRGLLMTSLLFGLLHFPQRYFLYSGAVVEALASALLVCAAGLLFGYVMLRSQNVFSSSILHLIGNWSALFWGISSF